MEEIKIYVYKKHAVEECWNTINSNQEGSNSVIYYQKMALYININVWVTSCASTLYEILVGVQVHIELYCGLVAGA